MFELGQMLRSTRLGISGFVIKQPGVPTVSRGGMNFIEYYFVWCGTREQYESVCPSFARNGHDHRVRCFMEQDAELVEVADV